MKHLLTVLMLLLCAPAFAQVRTDRWAIYRGNPADYPVTVPSSDMATEYTAVMNYNRYGRPLPLSLQPVVEHALTSVTVRFTPAQTTALPELGFLELRRDGTTFLALDVATGRSAIAARPGTFTLTVGSTAQGESVYADLWSQLMTYLF